MMDIDLTFQNLRHVIQNRKNLTVSYGFVEVFI